MKWWRPAGISIFWQTLVLLVGSLFIVQAVTIAIIVGLPPLRPNLMSMTGIATELAQPGRLKNDSRSLVTLAPTIVSPAPPPAPAGMVTDASLTGDLAHRLNVAPDKVRLYFSPQRRRHPGEAVSIWQGEALFFNGVVASVATQRGWRTLRTAEPPRVDGWQQRTILIIFAHFLLLAIASWFFARRLSRPIRQFAEHADRLGQDMTAPPVPVTGPLELRTTAIALNGMHGRIDAFLRERMAMSAAIAHDLRTPLARIAFRVEAAPDTVREPVLRDIEQMREMIAATLAFVKDTSAGRSREACDIAALLAELTQENRAMGQDVTLVMPPADRFVVQGDPLALRRMFQNLIGNALAYGGQAELTLDLKPGLVAAMVQDRGPGLPETMLERAFDPFVRHESSRNRETGGVGLGLTIARSIAVEHGGALSLSNRAGGGLAATVTLPLTGGRANA